MLGILSKLSVRSGEAEERMKAHFGVFNDCSDHEGEFQRRDGKFQMDGEEMLKEVQDFAARLACMYSPTCPSRSAKFAFLAIFPFFSQ